MIRMTIINNPTEEQLDKIIQQLENGDIIVYPTDTIYGIAANINNTKAIKKVYKTKKRPYNKPLSIIAHNKKQIKNLAYTNHKIDKIIDKLLPGAYTLLLKKKQTINNLITTSNTVGIRIPDNKITHKLTQKFPITTTSANITGKPTPDNIQEIKKQLGKNIKTYINTGTIEDNTPSTIIDLTNKYPEIIRNTTTDNNIKKILKIKLTKE